MNRLKKTCFLLFIILFLMIIGHCTKTSLLPNLTMEEAEQFFTSYENTLKSGDATAIKKYWSQVSLNRDGFDVMHLWIGGMLHISEWPWFFENYPYSFRVKALSNEKAYYLIQGEWINTEDESSAPRPMSFYLVWEDGAWHLINPIDILTRDWDRYETENMVFIYPKETDVDEHLHEIQLMDEKCREMCEVTGFTSNKKLEYYKASTPTQCGRLLSQPPFNGLAPATYADSIMWYQIAVSTTFSNLHEMMHVISMSTGIPSKPPAIAEGVAVAYGGTTFQTPEFAHHYSKIFLDDQRYIPVKKLMKMDRREILRLSYIAYQEAGSFIRFLIDGFGYDALMKFVSQLKENKDLDQASQIAFGHSLDNLEGQWHDYLQTVELLEIGFDIPDDAVLIFDMTDPENDEKGDGDYKYPQNESYVKGCFDLTRFQVFTDEVNAYFQIGLKEVIDPVSYRQGGSEFLPTIVIAVNKGKDEKRPLFHETNGVALDKGYDVKMNVGFGVNLSNGFGKIYLSTENLYAYMVDHERNTITFSVPVEVLGRPNSDWRYFVGIGLADEPAFNFSGLTPVYKDIPVLISGGNGNDGNPGFIDMLLPETVNQIAILSNYDAGKGKLARTEMSTSRDSDSSN